MATQLDAVFEDGVLRPLAPLSLAEHQRVRLTIEKMSMPFSWKSSLARDERREELEWLARDSAPYAGEWVALDGNRLLAHGPKLSAVSASARAAGVEEPFFASVPDAQGAPFAGW